LPWGPFPWTFQAVIVLFGTRPQNVLLTSHKGSLAAAVQSQLDPIVAGSLFSVLQSAAMGGYGAVIVAGTMSSTALIVTAATTIHSFLQKKDNLQVGEGSVSEVHSEGGGAGPGDENGDNKGDGSEHEADGDGDSAGARKEGVARKTKVRRAHRRGGR